eukprot:SAG11_NODE_440_length_9448_cov_3.356509_13_plen_64_part_00
MNDGGSGVLTPEMVLAAAEPPPEASDARGARAMGRNDEIVGLEGAWGEALCERYYLGLYLIYI